MAESQSQPLGRRGSIHATDPTQTSRCTWQATARTSAWAWCIVSLGWLDVVWAQESELRRIEDESQGISVRLATLVAKYSDDAVLDSARSFADRFTDAEILFLLEDNVRASLVLFDLVDDRGAKRHPLYPKVLYYLAEAQFQMNNDLAAADFFRAVVRRRDPEMRTAVQRLIQISDRREQWDGLDAQISQLRAENGQLPPAIAYLLAKSLLRQDRAEDVPSVVDEIPAQHKLRPKARYLVGVAATQRGDLREAVRVFDALRTVPESAEDARRIQELAAINKARLLFELGRVAESLDAYQNVSRDSPLFEEALYEVSWTHVGAASQADTREDKLKAYEKALKSLEILLLSEQETTLAPEARLLLGNILLRLQRFDDATGAFDEVVARYAPVQQELLRMTEEVSEPAAYYEQVAARRREGGGLLPPLAVRWAAQEQGLNDAVGVVGALDQGASWLEEIDSLLAKLSAMLQSEQRAQLFPQLHEAQVERLELANQVLGLNQRLLAVERDILADALAEGASSELEAILAERAALEPEFEKLPKSREEYEGRLNAMQRDMNDLKRRAFRLGWEVEEQRRSVAALQQWIADNPDALSRRENREFRELLARQEAEVSSLETLRKDVEEEIGRETSLLTVGTEYAREQEVRRRYLETLERERAILEAAAEDVDEDDRAVLLGVTKAREVLTRYHADLESFRVRLAELVSLKASEITALLLREEGLAKVHREQVDAIRNEARAVVGGVAYASLREVERKFSQIVLRGDVGILDVAWAVKEKNTQAINRWVDEQQRELQLLDNEYRKILEEK